MEGRDRALAGRLLGMRSKFPDDKFPAIRYFWVSCAIKNGLSWAFDGADVIVHAAASSRCPRPNTTLSKHALHAGRDFEKHKDRKYFATPVKRTVPCKMQMGMA
jgi:hypothetical protein